MERDEFVEGALGEAVLLCPLPLASGSPLFVTQALVVCGGNKKASPLMHAAISDD